MTKKAPKSIRLFSPAAAARRLLAGALLSGLAFLVPGEAAALTVTPSTWNIIGLDSNTPAFGPNRFPVGAKVGGGVPGASDTASFAWDAGGTNPDDGTYIYLRPGTANPVTITFGADGCADAYFEVEVAKDANAFDLTRRYHITAGGSSTATPRELYVEHLVSQARNYITNVKLNGASVPAGAAMNLMVGNTYTIELYGGTATQGYNQFEEFINFPNTVFQVMSVSTTYSANDSPYVSTLNHKYLYADSCGWENDPNSPYYLSCVGGDYKSGGNSVVTTYTVRIIGGGGTSETLNTLLYDFSGSSFHYNADFSTGARIANIIDPTTLAISKSFFPDSTNVNGASTLTFTLTNPNAGAVGDLAFTDVFPTSPGNLTLASAAVSNTCGGTLTDHNGNPLAIGSTGIRLTGGTAPAGGSCNNTTGSLYAGPLNTGKIAADSLTVNTTPPPPPPPSSCPGQEVILASWSMANGVDGNGFPAPNTPLAKGVATAAASYSGAGAQSIDATTGNPANSWTAVDGWANSATGFPNSAAPYFQFDIDTSNYGGAMISFDYALFDNQGWGGTNAVYIYSAANGGAYGTIYNTAATKNAWQNNIAAATAGTTGTNTTSFRINATASNGTKTSDGLYLDNVVIKGCRRPDPPAITKSFAQNPVAVNGTSTLFFTVTNPNSCCSLSGVTFTDSFPAGLSVASPLTTANTCGGSLQDDAGGALAAGDTGIRLTNGSVAAGAGATCTVTVNVTAATAGPHDNVTGYVSATETGTNAGPAGSASATLTAVLPPAISKQFAPNPILAGGVSTLTFLITNPNQNNALSGVAFSDTFPVAPGAMTVAAAPNATTSGCGAPTFAPVAGAGSISFTDGTLAAGATCTVTVDVTAPVTGTYNNTSGNVSHFINAASVSGNTAAGSLTVNSASPKIALLKQAGPSAIGPWTSFLAVAAGADVYYKFTVENAGDAQLSPVGVSDPLVSTASCVWPASLPVAVAANDNHIATCVVGPVTAVGGTHVNTATATGDYGGNPYTDQSSATYATTGLTLAKSATQTVFTAEGNVLDYSYTVTNSGSAALAGPVAIADDKSTDESCPAVSTVGDFDNYLDPGESLTCTATYTVTAADVTAKQVTNTATATAGGVTSPTATKTIPLAPDLTATKTNSVGGVMVLGGSFDWTLTVVNAAAAGSTYTVPATATNAGGTAGTINCAIAANTLTCTASGAMTMPPGGSFSVAVTVTPTADGSLVNPKSGGVCTADPLTAAAEIDETNNGCADTVTVQPLPSLLVVKSVQPAWDPVNGAVNPKAIPGAVMLYTIQVVNSGAGVVDNNTMVVTDVIPAETVLCVSNACSNPPVAFACSGTPPCGLAYDYATDVTYSNQAGGGAPYTYTPSPDADGFDAAVTGMRINPTGTMSGASGGNNSSFSLMFKAKVK